MRIALCAMVVVLAGCGTQRVKPARDVEPSAGGGATAAPSGEVELTEAERKVFERINEIRAEAGLAKLTLSPRLVEMAREHSRYQLRQDTLTHKGEGGSSLADRFEEFGLKYRRIAENVAMNTNVDDPAGEAVEGWLQSPGHRHNILTRGLEQTGVGTAVSDDGKTYYFTQVFYTPPSSRR